MKDFVPTVTISLREYKRLKVLEASARSIDSIKVMLERAAMLNESTGRGEFHRFILDCNGLLNQTSIWEQTKLDE